jgi:hypothetical protein
VQAVEAATPERAAAPLPAEHETASFEPSARDALPERRPAPAEPAPPEPELPLEQHDQRERPTDAAPAPEAGVEITIGTIEVQLAPEPAPAADHAPPPAETRGFEAYAGVR